MLCNREALTGLDETRAGGQPGGAIVTVLHSLERLSALALLLKPSSEAVDEALALLKLELAAEDVYLVYGVEDDFEYLGTHELTLSRNALWFIHRDLTTHEGLRTARLEHGRVVDFHATADGSDCEYLTALVPASRTAAQMVVALGSWRTGLAADKQTFLGAALPALGLLLQRRLQIEFAEQDHRHLNALVSVGRVISETEDLEAMLTKIAKMAAQLTALDYVTIDIMSSDDELQLRCVNYERPVNLESRDRWKEGARRADPIRTSVMTTRTPALFADAQTDARLPDAARRFFARSLIRSAAVLPLQTHDGVLGVLSVAAVRPMSFGVEERELLEGLATQIATAIKGVQLYEERAAAEDALRESERLLSATIESTADGILVVDEQGHVAYSNQRFAELWGIPDELLRSRNDDQLLAHVVHQLVDPDAFAEKVRRLYGSTDEAYDTLAFKDGRVVERYSRPLLRDERAVGRVWSFRDVTERTNAEHQLRHQARHDSLTAMLNHASITEVLREQSVACASIAVIMVDVDGMKAVNDTYGHIVGDEVLVAVTRSLQHRADAIVGRYGGDEFLVILPNVDRGDAERYCRQVSVELRQARVLEKESQSIIPVVASMGVSVYPSEAESIEDAVRWADNAMYAEKRERSTSGDPGAIRSALGDERAAKMIGEIVPMLTSQEKLEDKLRLVAYRLSTGAGYDLVRFNLASTSSGAPAVSTYATLPGSVVRAWDEASSEAANMAMVKRLRDTKRPIIVDDLAEDARYSERQKELLRETGLHSAVFVPMIWQGEFVGVLSVAVRQHASLDARDARFLAAIADQLTAIIRMESLVDDLESAARHLQEARGDTVVLLAAAAEAHDDGTGQHLRRVRVTSELLARELGYDDAEVETLGLAAILHDIGKIRVPESILLSPSRLNGEEWAVMKQHTSWGGEFLSERPGFEVAATIARAHHERWDGSGYPLGLAGEEIPMYAAIVSVADSLDAITNDRPYRTGRSLEWAVGEIVRCSGTQFSPRVVAALRSLYGRGALPFVAPVDDERLAA